MKLKLDPSTGLLPVGEHELKWKEICDLFGTTTHRNNLLELLHKVCTILKDAGVSRIWLNGSFVTSKERPGDYDLSYEIDEEIFNNLPENPFKMSNADTLLRGRFGGDIRSEPMHPGELYRRDLFPNVIGHTHNGVIIENVKKGIVVLNLVDFPEKFHA